MKHPYPLEYLTVLFLLGIATVYGIIIYVWTWIQDELDRELEWFRD